MRDAAHHGQLQMFKVISQDMTDKNPPMTDGWTPLHSVAQRGHLQICQFIMEHVENKSPRCNNGVTPLYMAAQNGSTDRIIQTNSMPLKIHCSRLGGLKGLAGQVPSQEAKGPKAPNPAPKDPLLEAWRG